MYSLHLNIIAQTPLMLKDTIKQNKIQNFLEITNNFNKWNEIIGIGNTTNYFV